MRLSTLSLLLLLLPTLACAPSLNNDDDDATGDDDDTTGDDDDATGDDDDATGDDDDSTSEPVDGSLMFGSSFGECWGACRSQLVLSEDASVTWLTYGWENEVYASRGGRLSDTAMEELSYAHEFVDLLALEPVYGCPDCADGGARSMVWQSSEFYAETAYEYGNPPDMLWAVDDILVAVEREIDTCVYGTWFDSIPDCDPIAGGAPSP